MDATVEAQNLMQQLEQRTFKHKMDRENIVDATLKASHILYGKPNKPQKPKNKTKMSHSKSVEDDKNIVGSSLWAAKQLYGKSNKTAKNTDPVKIQEKHINHDTPKLVTENKNKEEIVDATLWASHQVYNKPEMNTNIAEPHSEVVAATLWASKELYGKEHQHELDMNKILDEINAEDVESKNNKAVENTTKI